MNQLNVNLNCIKNSENDIQCSFEVPKNQPIDPNLGTNALPYEICLFLSYTGIGICIVGKKIQELNAINWSRLSTTNKLKTLAIPVLQLSGGVVVTSIGLGCGYLAVLDLKKFY